MKPRQILRYVQPSTVWLLQYINVSMVKQMLVALVVFSAKSF